MSHDQDLSHGKLKLFAGIGVLLLLFLVWIEGGFVSKTDPGLSEESPVSHGSSVYHIQSQETLDTVDWPARVQALKEVALTPKYPGRILEISVTPGAIVTRGQILVRLENSESDARLKQARAQLSLAEAESTRASTDARRLRHLYDKEAATRQSLDIAIAEERQSAARVLEAQNLVRQMDSQLSESLIRAPFDGVIDLRLQDPGEMALPGQAVLTFLQTPILRIEATLPASCISGLEIGGRISARTGNDNTSISGVIEELAPASDRTTETVLLKARIDPSEGKPPMPGTFVWMEHACRTESLILIPASAVTRIGQLESVSILRHGKAHVRHVRTGRTFGDNIEILSGLSEGDDIALGGH